MDLIRAFRFVGVFMGLAAVVASGCASARKIGEPGEGAATPERVRRLSELGLNFELIERQLPNGLRLLMVEDHTVPVVSYQTWVKVGSADEEFGYTGMAHLFEHLMFKGSSKYGPRAFFHALEAKGAQVNAYTTRDYTVFHETFIPSLLEKTIDLESDRLATLKVDDEALVTERQVVWEERRLRTESSPEGRMQEALWGLVFRSHPYRWPVIGYAEDLNRVTTEGLKEFFARHYHPANVTLVIVGDIDPARTAAMIEKAYGAIPSKPVADRSIPREPAQDGERRLELQDRIASEKVLIGYPITSAKDEDTHALDVLASILFGGTSTRAYRRIVEEKQIALGVNGVAYTPVHAGIFMMNATLKSGHTGLEVEHEIEALVAEIAEDGVKPEEIQAAVRGLTMQTVDSVRTAHGLGTLIGTVDVVFGDPFRFSSDIEKYQKVSVSDVQRVAAKYLRPERKNVVRMIPGMPAATESAEEQP